MVEVNGFNILVHPSAGHITRLNILGAEFSNACNIHSEQYYHDKTAILTFRGILGGSTKLEKNEALDPEKGTGVASGISSWLRKLLL